MENTAEEQGVPVKSEEGESVTLLDLEVESHDAVENDEDLNDIQQQINAQYEDETVELYECDKCEYKTRKKHCLLSHSKTHSNPLLCKHCDFVCMGRAELRKHVSTHPAEFKRKKYRCKDCDYTTTWGSSIRNHRMKHGTIRPYHCPEPGCEFTTKYSNNLNKHMTKHSDVRAFKCPICNYELKHKSGLKVHLMRHTKDKPKKCDQCNFRCRTTFELNCHKLSHSDVRPFECEICGTKTKTKSDLMKHKRTHITEKTFPCPECGKLFTHSGNLSKHKLTHRAERPYSCNVCKARFKTKGSRNYHMKTHQGVKPHSCDICGMKFLSRPNMITHKNVHTGLRPYPCPFCPYYGKEDLHVKAHIGTCHTVKRMYVCVFCNKGFPDIGKLRQHDLSEKHTRNTKKKMSSEKFRFAINGWLKKMGCKERQVSHKDSETPEYTRNEESLNIESTLEDHSSASGGNQTDYVVKQEPTPQSIYSGYASQEAMGHPADEGHQPIKSEPVTEEREEAAPGGSQSGMYVMLANEYHEDRVGTVGCITVSKHKSLENACSAITQDTGSTGVSMQAETNENSEQDHCQPNSVNDTSVSNVVNRLPMPCLTQNTPVPPTSNAFGCETDTSFDNYNHNTAETTSEYVHDSFNDDVHEGNFKIEPVDEDLISTVSIKSEPMEYEENAQVPENVRQESKEDNKDKEYQVKDSTRVLMKTDMSAVIKINQMDGGYEVFVLEDINPPQREIVPKIRRGGESYKETKKKSVGVKRKGRPPLNKNSDGIGKNSKEGKSEKGLKRRGRPPKRELNKPDGDHMGKKKRSSSSSVEGKGPFTQIKKKRKKLEGKRKGQSSKSDMLTMEVVPGMTQTKISMSKPRGSVSHEKRFKSEKALQGLPKVLSIKHLKRKNKCTLCKNITSCCNGNIPSRHALPYVVLSDAGCSYTKTKHLQLDIERKSEGASGRDAFRNKSKVKVKTKGKNQVRHSQKGKVSGLLKKKKKTKKRKKLPPLKIKINTKKREVEFVKVKQEPEDSVGIPSSSLVCKVEEGESFDGGQMGSLFSMELDPLV